MEMEELQTTSELSSLDPTEIHEAASDDASDNADSVHRPASPSDAPVDYRQRLRRRLRPGISKTARPHFLRDMRVQEEEEGGSTGDGWSSDGGESEGDQHVASKRKTCRISKKDLWAEFHTPPVDLTPPAAAVPPGIIAIPAGRTGKLIHVPAAFMRDFFSPGTGVPLPLHESVKVCLWAVGPTGQRPFGTSLARGRGSSHSSRFKTIGTHLGVFNVPEITALKFQHLGSSPPPPGSPATDTKRVYHMSVEKTDVPADAFAGFAHGDACVQYRIHAPPGDTWAGMTRAKTRARAQEEDAMAEDTGKSGDEDVPSDDEEDWSSGGGSATLLPGSFVPPAAALPPAHINIPARHAVNSIYLGKHFMTDFFCPGTGLSYPLEDAVELCLWAEGPSGRASFRRKPSAFFSLGFKCVAQHLGVYESKKASTLEFALLGSSPSEEGPTIYHLSVKKVKSAAGNGRVNDVAASSAETPRATPAPAPAAPAAAPPPAKKTKAPPALPPPAETPFKKLKPVASVPPPVPAPAPAPAAANVQLQVAQPVGSLDPESAPLPAAPHPLLLKACAHELKAVEELVRGFRDAPAALPPSDPVARQQRLDRAQLDVATGRAQELWASSGIYVARDVNGLLAAATPKWCGARVPPLSEQLIQSLQRYGAQISDSMASVLQGQPPYRLWVGPVGDGSSASQVISLEHIPAGSWVLQVPGEYLFGAAAVAAASHPTARYIASNGGGVSGGGCVVPLAAAVTREQLDMCLVCAIGRHHNDSDPKWRRLGDTALDFSGTVAALLKGPAADANLEAVEIDLPTGPTGVFLVACRDILPGERLVAVLG